MAVETTSPEQQLAWEREQRPRMAVAAALAGILTLAGGIYSQLGIFGDYPSVGLLQALTPALEGQPDAAINPRTAGMEFLNDKAGALIGTSVVIGLGTLLISAVLVFLYKAAKARRPETPKVALYAAIFGPIAVAVLGIARQVAVSLNAHDYVTGSDRTRQAIEDVNGGGFVLVINSLALAGQLALGFAFVLISLNAMRAGLLTRFMGVLGIIVGVLFVVPIGSSLPIVQCFWLIALAPLFLGRWANGMPPAWQTGRAEPWPSQQQMREARDAAKRGGGAAPSKPEALPQGGSAHDHDDEAAEPMSVPHSSSKKRRKRRR